MKWVISLIETDLLCKVTELCNYTYYHCSCDSSNLMKLPSQYSIFGLVHILLVLKIIRPTKTHGNWQAYNYFCIDLTLVKYQNILSPGGQLENTLVKLKVRTKGILKTLIWTKFPSLSLQWMFLEPYWDKASQFGNALVFMFWLYFCIH